MSTYNNCTGRAQTRADTFNKAEDEAHKRLSGGPCANADAVNWAGYMCSTSIVVKGAAELGDKVAEAYAASSSNVNMTNISSAAAGQNTMAASYKAQAQMMRVSATAQRDTGQAEEYIGASTVLIGTTALIIGAAAIDDKKCRVGINGQATCTASERQGAAKGETVAQSLAAGLSGGMIWAKKLVRNKQAEGLEAQAAALDKIANEFQKDAAMSSGSAIIAADQLPEDSKGGGTNPVITGSGYGGGDAAAATSDEEKTEKDKGLGDGFNTANAPRGPAGQGPVAGVFKFGDGGGDKGGGGGGGLGGGSTGAATDGSGEAAPEGAKLADMAKNAGAFESAGATFGGGGGSGGGGGAIDLAGMLGQLMPKKDEDEKGGKGSILDYGKKGEGDGPMSLLDKNANIFERIHQTYQEKNRKGNVGI